MPITFPRAVPSALRILAMSFRLVPMAELTPLRSGAVIAHDLGPSRWRAKLDSTLLSEAEAGAVRGWYDTLLSYERFYAFHNQREYPLAYMAGWGGLTVGGNPFSGAGTLTAVNANNVEVTLGALPVGFVLSVGDMLAFDYATTRRALHRVAAGSTANGAGQAIVEVRPHVRTGWSVGAAVNFHKAAARMLILPDTFSDQEEGRHARFSFEAIQDV
jgi:hypothetical protein